MSNTEGSMWGWTYVDDVFALVSFPCVWAIAVWVELDVNCIQIARRTGNCDFLFWYILSAAALSAHDGESLCQSAVLNLEVRLRWVIAESSLSRFIASDGYVGIIFRFCLLDILWKGLLRSSGVLGDECSVLGDSGSFGGYIGAVFILVERDMLPLAAIGTTLHLERG